MVPEVGLFCQLLISTEVPGPSKIRPHDSSNCRMRVSSFANLKVRIVMKEVPFYCADTEGFTGLGIELGEFHSGVGNEYTS